MPLLWLVGLALLGATVLLRGPVGENNSIRRQELFRYTPERSLAPLLAGAHSSTTADVLWLKALPDLSRPFADAAAKQRWLRGVIEVITDLDPAFETVYRYGASYLSLIAGSPERAIELLQKGVASNPGSYSLRVDLAASYLMHFDDKERARELLAEVAEDPRCDSFTLMTYTSLLVDEQSDAAAIAQWSRYVDSGNAEIRAAAELSLERTLRRIAARAYRRFEREEGRLPVSKDELRGRGLMAPEIEEVVLGAFTLTESGQLQFARLEELEIEKKRKATERWCVLFRRDNGRWPTLEEVLGNPVVVLPDLGAGRAYEFDEGRLRIVAEDAVPASGATRP